MACLSDFLSRPLPASPQTPNGSRRHPNSHLSMPSVTVVDVVGLALGGYPEPQLVSPHQCSPTCAALSVCFEISCTGAWSPLPPAALLAGFPLSPPCGRYRDYTSSFAPCSVWVKTEMKRAFYSPYLNQKSERTFKTLMRQNFPLVNLNSHLGSTR